MSHTADVVIVGAGIIGGSVAFHLLERDPTLRVVVLEKEPEPGTGATSKATGGFTSGGGCCGGGCGCN